MALSVVKRALVALTLLALVAVGSCAVQLQHEKLVEDLFGAVERALKFFAEDYSAINVDGLFGLRLGHGQLKEAIRECSIKKCDQRLTERLVLLEMDLNKASSMALPYLEHDDPNYYERFLATIDSPYVMPYKTKVFNGKQTKIGSNTKYEEERGDTCYARMLGTYKENDKLLPKCNITQDCWNYMTKGDTSAYFITHQLLYFIFIEHVGCRDQVESFVGGQSVRGMQEQFCQKIYDESRQLSLLGDVTETRKDLFLEQTVLCGPLGFEDFMRPDWIKMVLNWPDKRLGCFRNHMFKTLYDMRTTEPDFKNVDESNEKHENVHQQISNPDNGSTMRKLLREKGMKDGCLSHTSGLGFGALSTYLRYIVKYP